MRKIPVTGINLFQLIYILIREYEEKMGQKTLNLSLGNPDLSPDLEVLKLKAAFAGKTDYSLHTYAEDNNLNEFSEGLIKNFTGLTLSEFPHLKAVPIGGIKTATALLPLACGAHFSNRTNRSEFMAISQLPAYDVFGTWTSQYLGFERFVWPLELNSNMRLNIKKLRQTAPPQFQLIHVIRPGNPAAQGANQEEWRALIEFALEKKARIFNDAAYATLAPENEHVHLCEVAKDYPELEWAEAFSLSKSLSDPGARLGVWIGSKDFTEDFIFIKGNTDSGPVPHVMAAYGELFKNFDLTQKLLKDTRNTYQKRVQYLIPKLQEAGLKLACNTAAGFFTLWQVPSIAFGIDLKKRSQEVNQSQAEVFNRLVIEKTGIVGVHFSETQHTPNLIRYAVCNDVLQKSFQEKFEYEICKIKPIYLEN